MLPGDFPPWKLVYYYFSVWKKAAIFEIMQESLVEKLRVRDGKKEEPTVGIIDAQSVKNTLVSCEDKGFDAGKKIKRDKASYHRRYAWIDIGSSYSKRFSSRQRRGSGCRKQIV